MYSHRGRWEQERWEQERWEQESRDCYKHILLHVKL